MFQFIENFSVLTSTTIIKYIASFREYGYCYGLVCGQIIFCLKQNENEVKGWIWHRVTNDLSSR